LRGRSSFSNKKISLGLWLHFHEENRQKFAKAFRWPITVAEGQAPHKVLHVTGRRNLRAPIDQIEAARRSAAIGQGQVVIIARL
jgi:hypothetical protein